MIVGLSLIAVAVLCNDVAAHFVASGKLLRGWKITADEFYIINLVWGVSILTVWAVVS